jgi:signal transduction histidine kinase/HAMP domain-containing protein
MALVRFWRMGTGIISQYMRRLLPRTFFGQLVLGTVLVQTLFLVLFVWYTIVSQRNSAEDRSRQRVAQQLERLSEACSRMLAKGDMTSVHEVLELSRISPTIDVARLTDLKGATIDASNSGREHGLDPSELALLPTAIHPQVFRLANGQLEAVAPVLREGTPVALLWLEPNHAASMTTIGIVMRVCITYGGFALLANMLPIFLIVRRMTRPLKSLREATHRLMQNPALAAGFPLPVTAWNEAGELTHSFNAMVQELLDQRGGLLETLALLDSMLGNAPIGFAFFDHELRYVRVNESLARMHALPVDEHVGQRASAFYSASLAEQKDAAVMRVFESGEPIREVHMSGELLHAPDVQRSWVMHFYPVRTSEGSTKWVGAIAVEITERLKAEEALRKTEKLAAAGRLAASIAHEINNPLESVTNLLYLLGHHEPMDATAKEYVGTAQAELARVSEITQQTLRFYRQSTSASATNVAEILDSILALYHPRLLSSNVTVNRRFRGTPIVFGFSGELRQLFANLIGNAADAMPQGGRMELRVRNGRGQQGEGVRVTIADAGMGMSDATLSRIFEAFYTTKEATGTGLGLWVSEEIIRKHHGTVRVRSRQGANSGSIFMLFFPRRSS